MPVKLIVGALAAALWIAPAAAQTGGSTSGKDMAQSATGKDTTQAPGSGSDPSRNSTDNNTQAGPATESRKRDTSGDTGGTGSAATSGTGSSSTANMPSGGMPGRAGSAPGMTTGESTGGASANAETADALAKLHAGNQAEIEAGTWMKDRAQSSKVKDFAKKMVDDHGSMDKDVQSFAQKRGIDLTAGASSTASAEKGKAEHQLDEIKAMTGAQADRAYMDMMVRDHQKDVSATRQAEQTAKSNKDDEFAKLLDNSAKKMESHLKDAQKIDRELTQRQARTPSSQ